MQQDDSHLVSESKRGSLAAFNLIVERYQSQVYNLTARILGNRTSAEDVTQEAFISAHRAIGGFRGGSLRAWLLRIATNRCYDYLRSSRRRPEDSLDEAMLNPGFAAPSPDPSPDRVALGNELLGAIQQAILSLPVDQRTVLTLIDVQGLSYEEASEAISVSMGTVKSRLSRARAGVRDRLREHEELLPDQFRQ